MAIKPYVQAEGEILPPFTLVVQGKRISLHCNSPRAPKKNKKPRGPIVEFSRKARKNMLERVAEIDWPKAAPGLFLTLTYPPELENCDSAERKYHRDQFHQKLERHLERNVSMVWRVEWMPRLSGITKGNIAPHMHLLYFQLAFIPYEIVLQWWQQILGWSDDVHVWLERADSSDLASIYMAKYCAKESPPGSLANVPKRNKTGRHTGWRRKPGIPFHGVRIRDVWNLEVANWMLQRAEEILPWFRADIDTGFTLIGKNAKIFLDDFLEKFIDGVAE